MEQPSIFVFTPLTQKNNAMAESRNITFNVTFAVADNVTNPFPLKLNTPVTYTWGKADGNPPSEVSLAAGGSKTVSFGGQGAKNSATGTEGSISFYASFYSGFSISFVWDIPYSAANSGNVTLNGDTDNYFSISGDTAVPISGNSITMNLTITQIGPTN